MQTSRRDFLKQFMRGATVAVVAPIAIKESGVKCFWAWLQTLGRKAPVVVAAQTQKEMVVAAALASVEGRTALAAAMVEPIQTNLRYQAIGRKLLMVDELPQGALPRYERDFNKAAPQYKDFDMRVQVAPIQAC